MKLYFAYGSNLWREQMQARCPDHRELGSGVLKDYRWIITSRGYASIILSPGDEVQGTVYGLSAADEASLDRFEGVGQGAYRKETLAVEVGGWGWLCMVYVDPIVEEGKPKEEYVDRLRKGIADAALPVDYVQRYLLKYLLRSGGS